MTTELTRLIIQKIESEGPMSLYDFMSLALYHPTFGYYKNPNRIGQNGDFITSPEISQIFGELIALWFIAKWQEKWPDGELIFLELGPGRGTFLTDFLRVLTKMPALFERVRCFCLETNPYHQAEIRKKTEPLKEIHFIENLSELPAKPLFFFGNEFFDAFPIRQFVFQKNQWQELYLTYVNDFYMTGETVTHSPWQAYFPSTPKKDDLFELNPSMISFMDGLAQHLKEHGGSGLIIDYGDFTKPAKSTLQAVKGHQQVPLFTAIGETDLTTHIDFSMLQKIAQQHSGLTSFFTSQGEFLLSLGLRDRLSRLCENAASEEQRQDIISRAERLIAPNKMGELFKVMGFVKRP